MENYRLQSAYEKHLIIKIVLFQFVNSYLSLFYIGFYLKDMERLKELLLIFSLSQSLVRQLKEALLPFILLHLHLSLIFLKGLLSFCWRLGVSKVGAGREGRGIPLASHPGTSPPPPGGTPVSPSPAVPQLAVALP
ncbi:anoctamin-8-like, partial [Neopelma chrysocephalum]|uniref:anoctamin-8-like n=1 Tax=Neopelma chrysocephalum TaxID=114329 RepID=UPI000FCD3CA3